MSVGETFLYYLTALLDGLNCSSFFQNTVRSYFLYFLYTLDRVEDLERSAAYNILDELYRRCV